MAIAENAASKMIRRIVMVWAALLLLGGCPEAVDQAEEEETPPKPASEVDVLVGRWITETAPDFPHFEAYTFRENGTLELQQGVRKWQGTWTYQDDTVVRLVINGSPEMKTITRKTEDRFCWIDHYDPTEREWCHTRAELE